MKELPQGWTGKIILIEKTQETFNTPGYHPQFGKLVVNKGLKNDKRERRIETNAKSVFRCDYSQDTRMHDTYLKTRNQMGCGESKTVA